jgi:hypothetical protein
MHGRRFLIAAIVVPCIGLLWGCGQVEQTSHAEAMLVKRADTKFPEQIRMRTGEPRIATGAFDELGKPITIACATCHTTKPANPQAKLGTALASFHQQLNGSHGDLSCISCHQSGDGYASLRLADGRSLPFSDSLQLCAQCHGPQYRDYQHGAHGGMTGYWDRSLGARQKNHCIDCHDPHRPRYPTVLPAPRSNDRFLPGGGHE